jgi:transcriptional regulator with XRE-family HTH domain
VPTTIRTPNRTKAPGERIRDLRLNVGLSPEQLGDQVGVSGDTIRRIERGIGPRCPHPRTMFLLAEAFELGVTDIWTPEASL